MPLDFSQARLPPFAHQREDTEWLINHHAAFIASEMRTGKSKIVVDAAQFLYEAGTIDKVIVVAPAPVRDVWADKTLGEIAKHAWTRVPNKVIEYHASLRIWSNVIADTYLHWYVTNFEFIRSKQRLSQLLGACGPHTLLVGDESSFLKNHAAQQTKAFAELRKRCGRVVLLNGTPIFFSPLDLFSQGNLISKKILDCPYVTQYKARYALQSPVLERGKPMIRYGKKVMEVSSWTEEGLEDLQRRFAPYTVRRLQSECPDMPVKLDPVTLTATMEPETWRAYKTMRDEMVVWLKSGKVVTSATAAIKALRLSQITGGFLSGAEDSGVDVNDGYEVWGTPALENVNDILWGLEEDGTLRSECIGRAEEDQRTVERDCSPPTKSIEGNHSFRTSQSRRGDEQKDPRCIEGHQRADSDGPTSQNEIANLVALLEQNKQDYTLDDIYDAQQEVQHGVQASDKLSGIEIGREKLDVLLWFIAQRLEADLNLHLVAWSRFRAEVFRAEREVRKRFPQFQTALILGGQKKAERLAALALLKPETSPEGPVFVAGIEGTGSFGIDLSAAHTCVTLSSGYSPGRVSQTLDRVYGPQQKHPIAYYNVVCVGPRGQRTIDHDILKARLSGEDIATRTAAAWVKVLMEE